MQPVLSFVECGREPATSGCFIYDTIGDFIATVARQAMQINRISRCKFHHLFGANPVFVLVKDLLCFLRVSFSYRRLEYWRGTPGFGVYNLGSDNSIFEIGR